ncbi:beclin-1-like [Oscarella lobularis]|uniref:beclin-1-like n=1 Tax=Oscarella lobularis TaxID=121494 RepID=UPI0033143099
MAAKAVNFFCQRCYQPVELDVTFKGATSASLRALASTSPAEKDASSEKDFPTHENVSKRSITRMRATTTHGSEFHRLTEPDQVQMGEMSYQIKIAAHLFDILTSQGDFDHPLCQDCAEDVCTQLSRETEKVKEENQHYSSYLQQLLDGDEENDSDTDEDETSLSEKLAKLLKEEKDLKKRVVSMDEERKEVGRTMEKEQNELKRLEAEEKAYLERLSMYQYQKNELLEQQQCTDIQLKHAQSQLEKLKKTNIFNMTFHIWHSGHFGTINGFRLGRLPGVPVEWSEINAAWGQAILLLHALANQLSLRFERYKLIPFGNQSYIEVLGEKKKDLPLFGTGGLKFLWNSKFDQAMVAFLDCLQQFKVGIEKAGSGFHLPYRIEKDKIGDAHGEFSVKMTLNSEEHWTKALKFLLTNLKWGLAYVAAKYDKEQA